MGGSLSMGKSSSSGRSSASGRSFVDPTQAGYLADLYGRGAGLTASQMGEVGPWAQGAASDLYGYGRSLLPGSFGSPGAAQARAALMGRGITAPRIALQEAADLDPYLAQVGGDIVRQLQRQLGGAGGIGTGFGVAGTAGGGREQVERGLAQEAALNAFASQSAAMRLADLEQRRQLAGQQALLEQGATSQDLERLQAAGRLGLGETEAELAGRGLGLQSLSPLLNLGLTGYGAAWSPLLAYREVLGPAVTLEERSQTSRDRSSGWNFGLGS